MAEGPLAHVSLLMADGHTVHVSLKIFWTLLFDEPRLPELGLPYWGA